MVYLDLPRAVSFPVYWFLYHKGVAGQFLSLIACTSSLLTILLRPLMFSCLALLYSSCTERSSSLVEGLPVPWVVLLDVFPFLRRCLFTVRAAISFARLVLFPFFLTLSFIC